MASLLRDLFNTFAQVGAIPEEMLEASIVVIPKPGKDKTSCGAYRPISLLNIDIKLYTSILATRLAPYMSQRVEPDQAGFIPQTQTSDNTKRALHLIEKASRTQGEYTLLTIDAERAFDRVHWPYLEQVLAHAGFGEKLSTRILNCYRLPKAIVRVNGHTSSRFPIGRGTRQGCHLSPLLFALYMEPLALWVSATLLSLGSSLAETYTL